MKLIDDVKRDREEGTPGPWRAKAMGGDSIVLCETHKWHSYSEGYEAYPLMVPRKSENPEKLFDPWCASVAHGDARRIARVPALEAALLEAVEALEEIADANRGGEEAEIARAALAKINGGEDD